ncbi:MAG: chromosome segregation protein SMC, partial [Proteobacteria bacterium]|nr:chromosome segregation protein SMC [Pseudomonadota bacterium]
AVLEQEVDSLTRTLAAGEARRGALSREIGDLEARIGRLRLRGEETEVMRAALSAGGERKAALDAAEEAVAVAESETATRREQAAATQAERVALQAAEVTARDALQGVETGHAALVAEQAALNEMLGGGDDDAWPELIDEINVESGMEIALGAALGDDLGASSDVDAPLHWRRMKGNSASPLPGGAQPLGDVVSGPPALAWRLSQVGVVEAADGERLQRELAQGQRLVSREGALWRWDGLTMAADAASAAATRLRQRNRLKAVAGDIEQSESRRAEAVGELEIARAAAARAAAAEAREREALSLAEDAHHKARDARAEAAAAQAAEASRLVSLNQDATRIAAELKDAEEQGAAVQQALDGLEPDRDGRAALDVLRERLTECRDELSQRLNAAGRLRREAAVRVERLTKIAADLASWEGRADGAGARLTQLAERRAAGAAELDGMSGRPAEIDALRDNLLRRLESAQAARGKAADAVAEAETGLAALDRRMKETTAALAECREASVRAESILEQAGQQRSEVERAIHERLDCAPADLTAIAELKAGEDWPDEAHTDMRLNRLIRERDNIGPVNLRAEAEAAEIDEQLGMLTEERGDLEAAIARLRQGISRLNREGRERLEAAFEKINDHFSALFTRLFGGGNAHLSLVGSDDPLEAGLEIMASPPGKRLQILSLLSGGEQALTALSLLFAVFLTNPAPICVLDEVDASLDDANVARFCDLLEDIARGSSTRFMIITHHRMTMARMDRLFGVTMGERGVSQLVSVDLHAAVGMEAAE